MEEAELLLQLQRGDTGALERAIQTYGAYVMTIVRNRSRGLLPPEDQEELVSDVFVLLWQNAGRITGTRLRPWLGAVARNRTVEAMRRRNVYVPLEEEAIVETGELWQTLYDRERCAALARALASLPEEDRTIFLRFYDLSQTTGQIAQELGLNPSTVRSRLRRGRERLREMLCKGGIFCENDLG